jgi:hypothetical protein
MALDYEYEKYWDKVEDEIYNYLNKNITRETWKYGFYLLKYFIKCYKKKDYDSTEYFIYYNNFKLNIDMANFNLKTINTFLLNLHNKLDTINYYHHRYLLNAIDSKIQKSINMNF